MLEGVGSPRGDNPIISSLLEDDFYTFTVGQLVFEHYANIDTAFRFINRSKERLADLISVDEFREQLEHMRTLRFARGELYYLRGMDAHGTPMFSEKYLESLKTLQFPEFELGVRDGQFDLRFFGKWPTAMKGEVAALAIINQLRSEYFLGKLSRFEREALFAEGIKRLEAKIKRLLKNPRIIFSDFGTRRAFMRTWQDYINGVLVESFPYRDGVPGQFRGTSNVYLAKKYDIVPMGTNSHQLPMILLALARIPRPGDSPEIVRERMRSVPYDVLHLWYEMYGNALSISLPDTYGSKAFFDQMPEDFRAWYVTHWKGNREDSGNTKENGDHRISFYENAGVDPLTKMLIPSDGLDIDKMFDLESYFRGRIGISFGLGTNLTNDLSIPAVSIVIKPESAGGIGTVKLSDNLAKATGAPEDVALVRDVFGYGETFNQACTY